jgi:flagellar basal-body rod protein FlgC
MYNTLETLSAGLSAARARVNTLASNIANAETTRTPEGGPYRRKDIVQSSIPLRGAFSNALDRMTLAQPLVHAVVEDQSPGRSVYNPGHPDADADGNVMFPNINVVSTMTDLMSATRLYQANVTAIESARSLTRAALGISMRF